ncbi:hypothetical protein C0J52_26374 [Blattella germanica]|nr:hypothetical protein C0J52_26374 [Blattella germanica]
MFLLTQKNKRIANYCGIPERSVSKIRKEGIEAGENVLSSPGKKRPRAPKNINFIAMILKGQKIVSTIPKLLKEIRNRIDFPWEVDTLRNLLHSMGLKWKNFPTSTPAQRLMRGKY